jgi:hypothetical protein
VFVCLQGAVVLRPALRRRSWVALGGQRALLNTPGAVLLSYATVREIESGG